MAESDVETRAHAEAAEQRSSHVLYKAIPQVVVLVLTLIGVAYTSMTRQALVGYWEFLALITGLVCIISGWPHARTRPERVRLVWTQALHWTAFLVAMNLLLISDVQRMLSTDATGLAILLLLALGTFVAGVHTLSWQTCVLGLVMALSVPAIAWIEESALVLVFVLLMLLVVGGVILTTARRGRGRDDSLGEEAL
ncbi:hypothetical protein Rvan_0189 [Rhodomicrobium vannielii ATCC 17100]|jgi:hypothetical protein|uniref:Uncharacterized protein n=1 Tax=Rhodomicrobium vannielii (strain ATCC 17100 / DSM 162 / LMG 4299 / NCIMB 10020 / ATH 3.1.1) TaxID=648757 RepID=E3I6B8_RHOVT|nr:hypothetical protein [Rhodomicrobium vannielii]ADP69479.1 hypothetical protein Rvan_0189 [Rhodomicrobium vannielii ATCC 17100]